MNTNLTAEAIALKAQADIEDSFRRGILPATVRSFADLHDYVDANDYIIRVFDSADVEMDWADQDQADLMSDAMEQISIWLNARYHRAHGTTPRAGRHS